MSIPDRSRNPQAGGGGLPWITTGSKLWQLDLTRFGEQLPFLNVGFSNRRPRKKHTFFSCGFVGFKRWQCCCNFLSHGWFQDIYWYFRIHQWIMTIHDIWWATYHNIMIHCPNTEILHLANGFWSLWDPSRRFLARDNQSDKNGDRSGDTWCLDCMISVNYKQLTAWNQKTPESDWVY